MIRVKTEIDLDPDEAVSGQTVQDVPYVYMDRADSEERDSSNLEDKFKWRKDSRNGQINASTTPTVDPPTVMQMKPANELYGREIKTEIQHDHQDLEKGLIAFPHLV